MRLLLVALLIFPIAASARPLITSSEETFGQLCLRDADTAERMVRICEGALREGGALADTQAQFHINLGYAAEALDDLDQAMMAYRAALALDPDNAEAMNALAWGYWSLDEDEEALRLFEQSLTLSPTSSAHGGIANITRLFGGDLEQALEHIDTALVLTPDYFWGARERGWILFEMGRDAEALEAFNGVLHEDSEDSNAHFGVMTFHERAGDFDEALLAINAAISVNDQISTYYSNRAYVLRQLDRNRQALKDAAVAVALDPLDSEGYAQQAFAEAALGATARASEAFSAGIAAGAGDRYLHYWYADHLSDHGEMEAALSEIEAAIDADAAHVGNWTLKAYIALELDDAETGLAAAQKALALNADEPFGHFYRAVADVRLGRADAGLEGFDAAMKRDLPERMVRRFAMELVRVGKISAAIKLRQKY